MFKIGMKKAIHHILIGSLFISAALASMNGYAQGSSTATTKTEKQEEETKNFSITGVVGRSNSLYNFQDGSQQSSWDYSIAPSYKLTETISLSGLLEYSYDINKKEDNADFGRGKISISKTGMEVFNHRMILTTAFSAGLPISKPAIASSLQGSAGISLRGDANTLYLVSKKLSLAGTLGLTRSFHTYETTVTGKVNNPWSATQSFDTGWAFNDMFAVTFSATHIDIQSYQGTHTDFLAHGEEFDITVNKNLAFALGHQFGAPYVSTRKANGQDLNLALVDELNSFVYAQMAVSY